MSVAFVAAPQRAPLSGAARRRAAAYSLAALAVCCVAFLASQGRGADAPALLLAQQSGLLPAVDPDAPHARASTGQMYVPQFDPDRSLC